MKIKISEKKINKVFNSFMEDVDNKKLNYIEVKVITYIINDYTKFLQTKEDEQPEEEEAEVPVVCSGE